MLKILGYSHGETTASKVYDSVYPQDVIRRIVRNCALRNPFVIDCDCFWSLADVEERHARDRSSNAELARRLQHAMRESKRSVRDGSRLDDADAIVNVERARGGTIQAWSDDDLERLFAKLDSGICRGSPKRKDDAALDVHWDARVRHVGEVDALSLTSDGCKGQKVVELVIREVHVHPCCA